MLPPSERNRREFDKIIQYDLSYDPQLDLVHQAMYEANGATNDDEYDDAIHRLKEVWQRDKSYIDVTGRLYITDPDFAEFMPKDWGEPQIDDVGTWFSIPKTGLVSNGFASVGTAESDESGDTVSIAPLRRRIGYSFVLPEDSERIESRDVVTFLAFPGDIELDLPVPSAEAVDLHLHERYPDVMRRIDAALPLGSANITRSLKRLDTTLSALQAADIPPDHRAWLAQYIYTRLHVDTEWPYQLTIDGPFELDDGYGDAEIVLPPEPFEHYVKLNSLELVSREDSEKTGYEIALHFGLSASRDDELETRGSLVLAPAAMQSLVPTRQRYSLREQIANGRREKLRHRILTEVALLDIAAKNEVEQLEPEPRLVANGERTLERQRSIDEAIEQTRAARKDLYNDEVAAHQDSAAIAQQVANEWEQLGILGRRLITQSSHPIAAQVGVINDETRRGMVLPLDMPLRAGDEMASEAGWCLGVIGGVETIHADGEEPRYRINPLVILESEKSNVMTSSVDGVDLPMATLELTQRVLVPLVHDDDKKPHIRSYPKDPIIQTVEHWSMRRQGESLAALDTVAHHDKALVQGLKNLSRALYQEDDTTMTLLEKPQLIRAVGHSIAANLAAQDEALTAFDAIMGLGRKLVVHGTELVADGPQQVILEGRYEGSAVDHPYAEAYQPTLLLKRDDGSTHYLPLATIKGLSF